MSKSSYNRRVIIVYSFLFVLFSLIISRLVFIQLIKSDALSDIANNQYSMMMKLDPKRGNIYDSNMRVFATTIEAPSIYADPRKITDAQTTAAELSRVLEFEEAEILRRISKKGAFVWLERKVSEEKLKRVTGLGIEGIGIRNEPKRAYPNGTLGAHVLGFAGMDNIGLEGVELAYDDFLEGKPGFKITSKDAKRRELVFLEKHSVPAVDGYDVVLTIDSVIQHIAEMQLDRVCKKYKPNSAVLIVMEPKTGRILALANRPTYDPNTFENSQAEERRNRAITDMYEPGSAFKAVTASAILAEGAVRPDDKIFCENGKYRIGRHTLHDHKPHGWLKFYEVIAHSSNIGTAKAAGKLGPQKLYAYIRKYGFGQRTGVDLGGEVAGIVRPLKDWSRLSMSSVPMGQEIGVTALQMVSAVTAVANDGILMQPYIVDRLIDKQGEVIKDFSPCEVRRVIPKIARDEVAEILEGVVKEGTGKNAGIKGIRVAGKTGTAQKLNPDGTYSHSKFIASFVGFAPVEDPLVAAIVIVDEPRPYYYGSIVAAPAFKEAVEKSIAYLRTK